MKHLTILALAMLTAILPVRAAYPVHDTAHTLQTITGFAKQLEEWAKQHADMLELNRINDLIANYQKQLNDIVGDPIAAAKELIQAKELIDRLESFDSIEGFEQIEAEISALENVFENITSKPEIFGELPDAVGGITIERESIKYARHAVTTARVEAYETERNKTADALGGLSTQLATAQEKAAGAKTETELLASLAELQGVNAQLRLLSLRLAMRKGDVQAHAISVEDRDRLEEQNARDARRSEFLEFMKNKIESDEELEEQLKALRLN